MDKENNYSPLFMWDLLFWLNDDDGALLILPTTLAALLVLLLDGCSGNCGLFGSKT